MVSGEAHANAGSMGAATGAGGGGAKAGLGRSGSSAVGGAQKDCSQGKALGGVMQEVGGVRDGGRAPAGEQRDACDFLAVEWVFV